MFDHYRIYLVRGSFWSILLVIHARASRATQKHGEGKRVMRGRKLPTTWLEAFLAMTRTMQNEMGGKPMECWLLHDVPGFSSVSSNTRKILGFFCNYRTTDEAGIVARISFTVPVDAAVNKIAARWLKSLCTASLVCL
jgi:hypothetical protein